LWNVASLKPPLRHNSLMATPASVVLVHLWNFVEKKADHCPQS